MKKCKDCQREIDKYGIACQYCGRVAEEREKEKQAEQKRLNRLATKKP
jgi:hypothetical protein